MASRRPVVALDVGGTSVKSAIVASSGALAGPPQRTPIDSAGSADAVLGTLAGVVHALGPVSPGGRRWIHADLRLAPGNSGGPLADTAGHVVGLNTMITGRLALAIPINDVRRFVSAALAGNA